MSVYVVVRPGVLAAHVVSEVELEAIGHGPQGWVVVVGYDQAMSPILDMVHDSDIAEVLVEPSPGPEEVEALVEGELLAA